MTAQASMGSGTSTPLGTPSDGTVDTPVHGAADGTALNNGAALCPTCGQHDGADAGLALQRRLDDLVTRVAVAMMPVSASSLHDCLQSTLQTLSEFFQVDASFLRYHDLPRDMSILVAEWPSRQNVPDPDPLGEVPLGVDPVFDASRHLDKPFVIRPTGSPDRYQERVEEASGIDQVSMAMVPLRRNATTVGVLGFVKFGDRPWDSAETNALQAVASLLVQLQARVDAEERLAYHAYHDELTDLPNRRALLDEIQRRTSDASRHLTAVLYLDLDNFKVINDFLGHQAGDRLLVAVAERLASAMAPGDYVARLAGDEFVVLFDHASGAGDGAVNEVAKTLLGLMAEPIDIADHHLTRTGSIGISLAHSGPATDDDLLAQADAALHLAKSLGGNQYAIFDSRLRDALKDRTVTELLLREAIDHGGLMLYYQPEIDLRTGQLLAVEALVRWNHPERGVLAAGVFIEMAEETGMIVDLGRWVLAEAGRQMAAWRSQYPDLRFTTRVNMSPAQLVTRNIVELVGACLTDNHLPGRALCLEITEMAVMQDGDQAVQVLQDLKSLGVSLALDDFGTGYSSMKQLKRLPVDSLKIDQGFVLGLGTDDGDRAIVDATVRLARTFGLEVIAEGVETVELVRELLALGCDRAQGYLLCRPKPAADLASIFRHGGIDPSILTGTQPTRAEPAMDERDVVMVPARP